MCDCFHLAFPNWHGSPGTGAGRRLKGPEPGVDDDSICEEASEVLEEERPRPQGSSPVNEYPVTEKYTDIDKQAEEDIYDPYHKSSSIKKGKRIGFGSFFEKRSSAKISQMEDPEGSESRVFVRTVKEATSEGLVVSGGGKEGIFIKEVKPDSPASKHLTVKKGDQILSATVYFDNISYEDALQILEHAQAYRMEMCLKRKRPASTVSTLESSTDVQPDVRHREERAGPEERGRKAQRRHDVRISWPKFSSLGKGRKAVFKRSHSTSEAEDEKRLEMSPSTSDTESPLKTKEDAEAKTKKAKMKLKKTGLRSKSVDPDERLAVETHTGFLEFVEKHHPLEEASSQPSPEKQQSLLSKMPHIFVQDDQEKKESVRIQKECTVPYMPDFETEPSQHKAELISLDKTLKTTDITDSLADQGRHSPKRSPDGKKKKKKQRSELKVNIQGKEREDLSPGSLIKSPLAQGISTSPQNLTASPTITRTTELSVSPDSKVGPKIISHTQLKEQQMAIDINTQSISGYQPTIKGDQKSAREVVISPFTGTGVAEDIKELKADVSISNVGVEKKPPKMDSGKQWKERSILISDLERYGIRNRGPAADIGIARSHYVSSVNEVQTSMIDKSDASAVKTTDGGLYENILDINRPRTPTATSTLHSEKTQEVDVSFKDDDVSTAPDGGIKESLLHIQPPLLPKDINKDFSGQIEKQALATFKLPKMDKSDFSMHEPILKTDKEKTATQMEIKGIKAELRDPTTEQIHIIESSHMDILPKREDIEIPGMEAVVPSRNIQMPSVRMTMDIEMQKIHDIKGQYSERDSALFKLPCADLSDIDLQQHITKTDVNAEKVKLTASVSKPAEITEKPLDVKGTVPIQGPITDVRVPEFKIDSNYMIKEESKQSLPIFKLPRTEFPDADTYTPIAMPKIESSKITMEKSGSKEEGYVQKAKIDAGEVSTEMTKIKERDNIIKLPKREDIEIPGMEASVSAATIQTSVKQSFRSGETDGTMLKTKTEIGEISSTKSHSAIKLPKVKHPDLDIHLITKTDISTEKSGLELESLPTVLKDDINVSRPNAAGSKINLEAPKIDTDVGGVLPETDIKGTSLEATADIPVSLPSVDVSLKKPDIDREVPKVSADVPSVDVRLPEAELTVSGQAASVAVKGPKVEVEGRDVDGHGSNFKMPRFGISLSKVKATESDVEVTLPEAKLEAQLPNAELQAPSVEGEVEILEKDVKGLNVKIKKPKISFPNIDFQKTELKAPEAEITIAKGEISLRQASTEVKGSKVDTKITEVDVKEDAAIGDIPSKSKVPCMKLPKFGATKGKVEGVDVSADVNVLEIEAPSGEVAIKVKAPDTETEGMGLEVDKTKGKFKLPKVKMPDINVSLPRVSGPEINLKGPKVETDVSVSMPETDIKGPSLGGTAGTPTLDPEGKIKFQMPHIKVPSFGISEPEVKGQELFGDQTLPSVDVSLKKPDIDIDAPKVSAHVPAVDVKLPEAELTMSGQAASVAVKGPKVEVEGRDVDGHGSNFKMPRFGISLSKVKATESDVEVTLPEAKLEAQLPNAELQAPSVEGEVEILEKDIKGLDVKIKKPKISFPNLDFQKTKLKAPEAEITIAKGEISLRQASTEVKGSKVDTKFSEVDVKEDAAIGDIPSKSKVPCMKLPKFGATKGKVEGVDVSADINIPEVELPSGEVAIEVKAPDTEGMGLEVDKTKGKFKLPKVTMPDINVSLPKVSGPEVNLKGAKVETDLSVSKPETGIKGPCLETTADIPAIETEGKTKFQMPHIKVPYFGISKPELKSRKLSGDQTLPSGDVSLKKADIDMEAPKVSADVPSVDVKLPEAELTMSGQAASVDVKGPSVKVEGPDIDGQGSKFKMPKFGISFPKVKAAGAEISTSKPDVDVTLPEATLETQLPSAELEAPSVEGEVEIPEMDVKGVDVKIKKPKISFPKFGFSKTEVKGSEAEVTIPKGEISLPQASVEVKGPKVDIKSPDVDVKADAGIGDSPSKFKLSSIKLPKFGATKGKVEGVDVSADINVPDVEAPSGEVAIEVKAPDTETEGMGLEVDKTKGKFKLPKVKMPDINVSLPKVSGPEINLKGPKVEMDVSVSESETGIKGPSLETTADIPAIEPEGKIKFQMPHIKIPYFGISKPELKSRKLSGDQTLPSGDVSLKKADIDMEAPKVSADVPSVDVKLPEAELTMSGQAASVDVKGPSVEVEGPDVDGQGSKFKMPKFGISFPKVKAAGAEISTSKPDVDVTLPEATLETQLPSAELEAPSVEGEVEIPEMDVKGVDVKIKKPKISFPKFGFSKTEVKGPEAEVTIPKGEISLPQASVEVKGPKVDIKSPDVDVKADAGIGDSPSKFKLSSIKLPKFGATKGKVEGVDVSADINVPDVEAPSGEVAIEVKAPDTETEGMGLEVDKTKGKFKLPKVKMPDINVSLPKVSGPEINLKGPKVEMDVSVSESETGIKGPSLETTADIPAIEPEGKTKFQMPHIKIPYFGISKPELKSRKLSGDQTLPSGDVSLKKADIDMEAPKVSADVPSVDVKLPEAELTMSGQAASVDVKGPSVEVEGPDVDGQGSKFKMPKFGISFPKVKAAGAEISTSKPDVDVTLPEATLETQLPSAELEAPSVEGEVEIPEIDVKGVDVKIKKPKISFPKFGFSKTEVKGPEAEVTIPKGEISLAQASVEVKGPKVDIKSPDVDVKADAGIGDSPSKFKLSSIKLPKFGATKGKAEGVDVSADINVPDVEAPSGEVAIEVKAPDTETEGMGLEVDKTKGKFKLPKVKMPDINVSLPRVSGPEINLKGPKVEMDVSVSEPETGIKGPSLETTANIPAIEPEGKIKFQLPSFGISKSELKSRKLSGDQTLPSGDVSLKKPDIDMEAPKVSGDVPSVDVKLPEAELTMSGQLPSVDVKGPSVKVEGPDVDGQGSKFKMPKFGISFPKVKAAGPEISTSKPHVDVTLPKAKLEAQLPSAELEAPSVEGEVEIPEMDIKGPDVKIKKSKISFPKFGFSKTEVKGPEAEVTIPKGEISLPQASVEVKGPKVDIKSPDVDVKADAGIGDSPSKFKLSSIKLPKFGATKGKVEGVDVSADINVPEVEVPSGEVAIEVKAPDTETEGMGLEVDKTKGKFKLPKVTMSDINVSLPKVSGPEINLKGPKVETDVSISKPETGIKGPSLENTADIPAVEPGGKIKFQMPHIKIPYFGISKPELKSRKLSGDQTLPSGDVSLKKADIDMEAPKVSADVPSVDVKLPEAELTMSGQAASVDVKGPSVEVEGPDIDGQGSKFKMPKFGISFPKVKAAGAEISTSKPDVDVTLPEAKLEAQLPSAELEAPSVEGEVEIPEMDVKGVDVKIKKPKISFPKFGFSKTEVKGPEAEVTIPKGEISLPQASVEVKGPKVDIKSPDVDVKADAGIGDSPSKFKLSSIKLPIFGATKGKVAGVDVSADINVPDVEAPSGEVAIEVKAPDTETEGMGLEVDKTKGKFKLPKVTMSDINVSLPKVSGPEINLKGPKAETDVSVSKPETGIKGPSLENTADIPAVEPGGKIKFQLPSFGISKPELKSRKSSRDQILPSGDVSLKKPDIDMEAPKVSADVPSVDVKLPEAELTMSGQAPSVDVKGPSVKVEGPDIDGGSKFKMPKFGISFPKVKAAGPEISTSKPEVDVTLPEATLETQVPSAELEAPSVEGEVEIPEMDVKGVDVKIKKRKISFPKFGFSKTEVKGPEAEVTIPKGEISLPQASVEVKGPKVDIKSPDVDVKADAGTGDSPSKFKLSSIKLPKFGATKGKVEGVDASADINVPDVEAPSGEVAIEVKAPDTETEGMGLEVDKTKGKFKLPKVKMPDIDVSLPKVSGPEINLKGPKAETDVSVSKPETGIKGPSLENTADIPAVEPGGKIKFQLPSFGISKSELNSRKSSGDQTLPSGDVSLKKPDIDMEAPKVSADVPSVDVKLPEAELTMSGQAPSVDIKGPSVKVEGPDIDGGSKFKMPKFGISFLKVKAAGPEISTSKPEVDVTLPEATLETQVPSAELEAPSVEGEVEIPEMDVKGVDVKIKKRKISFPKFGFSKTEVKGPEAEVTIPKGEISLPQASVEVKGPKVDIKSPDVDVKADAGIGDSPSKFKLSSIKLPIFGATKGKVAGVDVSADINVPEVEVPLDEVAIEVKVPDTELEGPTMTVSVPEAKTEVQSDIPDIESTRTEAHTSPSKFKVPTFKMPKFSFSPVKRKPSGAEANSEKTDTDDKISEITHESAEVDKKTIDVSTEKTSSFSLSFQKPRSRDMSPSESKGVTHSGKQPALGSAKTEHHTGEILLEAPGADKGHIPEKIEEPEKSSKFSLPSFGDIFKGLELEFYVPTLEEAEQSVASRDEISSATKEHVSQARKTEKDLHRADAEIGAAIPTAQVSTDVQTVTKEDVKEKSKFKFWFPKIGFSESLEESKDVTVDTEVEKRDILPETQEKEETDESKTDAKEEKGSWFTFPKFGVSSPSKTAKETEIKVSYPKEDLDKGTEGDAAEDVSLTSSVKSSDAFADISSTITSEQVGLSETSPEKVTVKYSEPSVMVGVGQIKTPSDVITSTARTELIRLEPQLPDPVTVCVTSPSQDTLTDTGDIHIVTSNIQALPGTEHATIITKFETVETVPLAKGSFKTAAAPWTVEAPTESAKESSGGKEIVEKYVIKEKMVDDKGTVIITEKVTHAAYAASEDPDEEDATSAVKKLKDSMHSEKMRFFDGAET